MKDDFTCETVGFVKVTYRLKCVDRGENWRVIIDDCRKYV